MRIRIQPVDKKNKADKKAAKLLQQYMKLEVIGYQDIIAAIHYARQFIEMAYGVKTSDYIWNNILEKVVKRDIKKEMYKK